MSTKPPPYNTGKVKIGSRYEPPIRREFSRDEELIQDSLLHAPRSTDRLLWLLIRYCWGILAMVLVLIVMLSGFRGQP